MPHKEGQKDIKLIDTKILLIKYQYQFWLHYYFTNLHCHQTKLIGAMEMLSAAI